MTGSKDGGAKKAPAEDAGVRDFICSTCTLVHHIPLACHSLMRPACCETTGDGALS
jgi:hypothetical protein